MTLYTISQGFIYLCIISHLLTLLHNNDAYLSYKHKLEYCAV